MRTACSPSPRRANRKAILSPRRRWYELAARLDATDPVIPFNLGNVLDELGFTREAEIAYRQAIARSPDMADAWFNLAATTGKERAGTRRTCELPARLRDRPDLRERPPQRRPPAYAQARVCGRCSAPGTNQADVARRRRQKSDASRISAGLRPRQQRHANKLTRSTLRLRRRRCRL